MPHFSRILREVGGRSRALKRLHRPCRPCTSGTLAPTLGFDWGQGAPQLLGFRRVVQRGFKVDDFGSNQLFKFPVEVLHAFRSAVFQGFQQSTSGGIFALQMVRGGGCVLKNLDDSDASPVLAWNQSLGNHIAQSLSQTSTHRRLLGCRERLSRCDPVSLPRWGRSCWKVPGGRFRQPQEPSPWFPGRAVRLRGSPLAPAARPHAMPGQSSACRCEVPADEW